MEEHQQSSEQPGEQVADATPLRCMFCGETERVEVLEVWGHEFMLDTCCEGMRDEAAAFMERSPKEAGRWLQERTAGALPAVRRIVGDETGGLLIDYRPEIRTATLKEVQAFVERHHRHCAPPRGWRFGCAAVNGGVVTGTVVGVVSVGRPVARCIDQQRVVEVNRLCIAPDLARGLVWNVASQLYGWAAQEARRRGFEWIVTYTLAEEDGASLLAAGWEPDHRTRGRSWSAPSRHRGDVGPTGDKIRWRMQLVKRPTALLRGNAPWSAPGASLGRGGMLPAPGRPRLEWLRSMAGEARRAA